MNHALIANGVEADLKKIAKVGRGKRDLILIAAIIAVGGIVAAIAVDSVAATSREVRTR